MQTIGTTPQGLQQAIAADQHASGILPAELVHALITRRHRRSGPDHDGIVARVLAWIAYELAATGHHYVDASPRTIERSYTSRGATCGGMERHGMDATTLRRHWHRIAPYLVTTSTGKVRLKRSRHFHALPCPVLAALVFDARTPELRAALGALPRFSYARRQGKTRLVALAEPSAVVTGQGPSRWCVAVRGLRIKGLVDDDHPGRRYTDTTRTKHPARKVRLTTTPLVPLAKDQIRWTGETRPQQLPKRRTRQESQSDAMGHSLSDMEPCGSTNASLAPRSPRRGASVEGASASGASAPPALDHGSETARTESEATSSPSTAPTAPPPTSTPAPVDDAGQWTQGDRGRAAVRRELSAAGLDGQGASARSVHAIAQAVGTIGVLRRLISDERDPMTAAGDPIAWLAHVCRAEGAAVRAHDFVSRARQRAAESDPETGRRARNEAHRAEMDAKARDRALADWMRRLASEAGDDPAKMLAAARALHDEARLRGDEDAADVAIALERQADAIIGHRRRLARLAAAVQFGAAWPAWHAVTRAAATIPEPDHRQRHPHALAAYLVRQHQAAPRWFGAGDVVLVTTGADLELAHGADELAHFVAGELAAHERTPYRVTVEDAEGRRLAVAYQEKQHESQPESPPSPDRDPDAPRDPREPDPRGATEPQRTPTTPVRETGRPGAPQRPERARILADLEHVIATQGPGWQTAAKVLAGLRRRDGGAG